MMNKKLCSIMILLIFMSIFVVTSCGNGVALDEEGVNSSLLSEKELSSYFPSKEGMYFEFAGVGNEFASFNKEIKFKNDSLVQIHENNGGTQIAKVYRITDEKVIQLIEQAEFYSEKNLLSNIEENIQFEEVILQTPLEVGNSWISGDSKREIVAVDEKIEIPVGEYSEVIKVRITPTDENRKFEIYEYYAKEAGLIMRESVGEGYKVTSMLESYGQNYNSSPSTEDKSPADKEDEQQDKKENKELADFKLALLAYQLNHQVESTLQAAYESYINLEKLTDDREDGFKQIIKVLEDSLNDITEEKEIEKQVKQLEEYYEGGEGEVTFPTHEVVKEVEVTERAEDWGRIELEVMKYYPKREWSGEAHSSPVKYKIDLSFKDGKWKLAKVVIK